MEIKKNGEIIKFLRKVKKLTQEELASDICSVKQLRRIEKGEPKPSVEIFEKLLTQMGEDVEKYSYDFINISDENVYIKVLEIENLIFNYKYVEAREALEEIKGWKAFSLSNKFYLQFVLHCETVFLTTIDKKYEEALKKGNEAINITIKNFSLDSITTAVLFKREYSILNTMALTYISIGEIETGVSILTNLKTALNRESVSKNIKQSYLSMICYNLSKCLGLQKKYREAMSICDEGIAVCIEAKTLNNYGELLYNKAYDFYFLGELTDAKENFLLSYNVFILKGNKKKADTVKENAINKYGISL